MFKALLKKQFLELNVIYFQSRRTGKRRATPAIVALVALFLSLIGGAFMLFYALSAALANAFLDGSANWLYFTVMAFIAAVLGVFGSVINTYAALYRAKDNALLLSMPIPPFKIVLARMSAVYAVSLLYESLVLVPAIVRYWAQLGCTLERIVFPLLLLLAVGLLVLSFTCILGWFIAFIASKLKNRSLLIVVLSLLLFGAYFYLVSNIEDVLHNLVLNGMQIGRTVMQCAPWLVIPGKAGLGDAASMAILLAFAAGLALLTVTIMAKTFLRVTLAHDARRKRVYREAAVKPRGVRRALLYKEWRRFASSANYMLNCGLGAVFMLVGGILLLLFQGRLSLFLVMLGAFKAYSPIAVVGIVSLMTAMSDLTAPSVSLEGKQIWILQSMPISGAMILDAKCALHALVTTPGALFLSAVLCRLLKLPAQTAVWVLLCAAAFVLFTGEFGLALNLKFPNLTWTSEVVPIKQSLCVFFALFGGWLIAAACAALSGLAVARLRWTALACVQLEFALLAALVIALRAWLRKRGARILERL